MLLFCFAAVTLLKGKIWTGLFGLFLPVPVLGRRAAAGPAGLALGPLAVPGKPKKLARAARREERIRQPVIRTKMRLEDLVALAYHDMPTPDPARPACPARPADPAHPPTRLDPTRLDPPARDRARGGPR